MWFLIKSAFGVAILAAASYTVFFVDMGHKPLAQHIADVWGSEVVQEKVTLVRDGVKQEIEDRLADAAERTTRKTAREAMGSDKQHHEFDEEDTEQLEALITTEQQ